MASVQATKVSWDSTIGIMLGLLGTLFSCHFENINTKLTLFSIMFQKSLSMMLLQLNTLLASDQDNIEFLLSQHIFQASGLLSKKQYCPNINFIVVPKIIRKIVAWEQASELDFNLRSIYFPNWPIYYHNLLDLQAPFSIYNAFKTTKIASTGNYCTEFF